MSSHFDELSMEQSLLFSDSLKDLKNLKSQLYSAADYFELSYATDDQKQIVFNTLKEYAIKALINTVDHLGSVSFKVNGLLDEKVDVVSIAESRVSSIEQKIRTCQAVVDGEGLAQQSLVIKIPRYHKRYTLPAGESLPESGGNAVPKYEIKNAFKDNPEILKPQAVNTTTVTKTPSFRKMRTMSSNSSRARSVSPRKLRSPSPAQLHGKLLSSGTGSAAQLHGKLLSSDKRAASPIAKANPLARSGSLAVRSATFNASLHPSLSIGRQYVSPTQKSVRSATFNASLHPSLSIGRQFVSATQKSVSMQLHAERNEQNDGEQIPSKGKKFLKALLSRRKSKKDDMVYNYNYLDEY